MVLVLIDFLIKLSGYMLVTFGVFMLYLIYFRKDRMPPIFSKLWFIVLMTILSSIAVVAGWFIAVGV